MGPLTYTRNCAASGDIEEHLANCDLAFSIPLSERVNISDYSVKIRQLGMTLECWEQGKLVGLVAAYLNDEVKEVFITSVSTIPTHYRRGIARQLLLSAIDFARVGLFISVRLEVAAASIGAISLYKSLQFQSVSGVAHDDLQQVMVRDLSR